MAEVVWAEPAVNDLRAIVEYIAQDSRAYAERLALKVLQAARRLATFPQSGRVVPEFGQQDVRELIYGSYRLIYVVRSSTCYVVGLVHGSRQLLSRMKPGEWEVT